MAGLPLVKRIGHHIRRLRLAREMSQEELAAAGELNRTNLSHIENGHFRNLGVETLERICLVLHLSVKEFFDSLPGE